MKCLILQGSPRSQGNTASLTGPFEEELRALGNECTAVRLYEKKILPCTACRRCQNDWSSFFCVQKDDMAAAVRGGNDEVERLVFHFSAAGQRAVYHGL